MQKFLCKNYADRQIKFDGHSVPSGAYYGQTANGLRFIAVVRVNQIGMVWRSGKGLVTWEKSYNQTVVDFIRSEPIGVNPETVHFDMTVKSERKKAGRYAARLLALGLLVQIARARRQRNILRLSVLATIPLRQSITMPLV